MLCLVSCNALFDATLILVCPPRPDLPPLLAIRPPWQRVADQVIHRKVWLAGCFVQQNEFVGAYAALRRLAKEVSLYVSRYEQRIMVSVCRACGLVSPLAHPQRKPKEVAGLNQFVPTKYLHHATDNCDLVRRRWTLCWNGG